MMNNIIYKHRFLILRRISQFVIIGLFAAANYLGWTVFKGNLSSGLIFEKVPMSDPFAALQMAFAGFIAASDVLIGALITLVIYGLFAGRMFCSWVCPVNIVEDSATYLSSKLKIKANTIRIARNSRYWILGLSLILSLFLGYAAFEAISPISIMHRGLIFGFGAGWAIIAALFLFDMAVKKFGWCGHLCPLGAFYALIGKYALIKVKHNHQNCTACNKCFEVCPEVQVLDIINKESGIIKSSECTNCARCIEVCDDDALNFGIRNYKKK